jgi:hypothetical protein
MYLSLVSNKETKLKLTALTFEPGILFNRCSQLIGFFHFRDMQIRKKMSQPQTLLSLVLAVAGSILIILNGKHKPKTVFFCLYLSCNFTKVSFHK